MRLYLKVAILVCLILALRASGSAADTPPKVFGGAQIQEVFRIRLDRDDLVLEAIDTAIKEHNIQDGAVLTGVGSVQACTYHGVQSLAPSAQDRVTTIKGPTEILNLDGIIAAGEPHVHITLANYQRGAFGGHLENGCKVLYRVELTVVKFSGVPLARKPNREGTPVLQEK